MHAIRFFLPIIVLCIYYLPSPAVDTGSVYSMKPDDPEAYYFTPEEFNIRQDGKMDVSEALQGAINKLKKEKNYGILFIPEGKYKISKTIYIPNAIRLIGYGMNRPEIILERNSPGYQIEDLSSGTSEKYMFWFTSRLVDEGDQPRDASPGTFYSALSNIDLTIDKGNPIAVALRTHYAQHGFINHSVIRIGEGKAGISQVGNEIENVRFMGGDYGIMSGPTSPSWPMMIVDTYFEGQRKAAIRSRGAGLAVVHLHARKVPVVMEIEEGYTDRLFFENCLFEDVKDAGFVLDGKTSSLMQVNTLHIDCSNVPVFVRFRNIDKLPDQGKGSYRVKEFVHGLVMKDLASDSEFQTSFDVEPVNEIPNKLKRDIPPLPPMSSWVNIRSLGAIGDGEADDTHAIQNAIDSHEVIYFPQGWYRITDKLTMKPGTKLIGLHPWATQFVLKESEPAFSGFGIPVPLLESSQGGNDIVNGIGIATGGYNYRAIGCKWMAGEASLMNDVKFVGGHGTMRKPSADTGRSSYRRPDSRISSPEDPVREQGMDLAWDNQYWSLWITNGGGGTFKDIWTANTYASSGLYVSNTNTPGRIYAMSLEHHVRNEARFDKVSNWKAYAFQFEEEGTEGKECQMIELSNCSNIRFGNLWLYRVIRVTTPKRFGMRIWNCNDIEIRNLHNYTQKLWVTEFPVWDANRDLPVYPWEIAHLTVTGREPGNTAQNNDVGELNRLATGFDFAQGITSDSKGNIYFCETRKKRIYKWSAETGKVTLLADYPLQPFVLATDSEDNLLVIFRYDPQPGFMVNGEQERVMRLPDDNVAYSSYGNSGWAAYGYSIDPDNPDETFRPLPRVATSGISQVSMAYYPASRWHYTFDKAVTYFPDSAFAAPDGKTIIPETYDIGRCAMLFPAVPGQSAFASDERKKLTVRMSVGINGELSQLDEIIPRGETAMAIDKEGNMYVADGQIFVYDRELNEVDRIDLTERPISITFGGKDKNILFITTIHSLYSYRVY